MYTIKITLFYSNEKLLFLFCGRCNEEGKIGMISLETIHKSLYIHVSLEPVAQEKLKKQ